MQNVSEGGRKDKKTKIDQKQGNWENQFLQSRLPWDDGVDDYSKIEDIKGVGWDNFTFDYSEEIGNSFSHDRGQLVLQKILQKVLFLSMKNTHVEGWLQIIGNNLSKYGSWVTSQKN